MGDETHQAGDGGAWGTWVGRIEQLEAEIERLRAENQRLTDENVRAWNACNEECQRKEELQALIDVLGAAHDPSLHFTAWWDAIDALLAAATQRTTEDGPSDRREQDDRG